MNPWDYLQRHHPFGRIKPREVIMLQPERIHPVIRIAHRGIGSLMVGPRIIFDHELVLILAGRGDLRLEDELIPFKAHDLLLVRPFAPHSLTGRGICDHVAVHFDFAPGVPASDTSLDRRKPYEVQLPRGATIPTQTSLMAGHPIEKALLAVIERRQRQDVVAELEAVVHLMTAICGLIRTRADNGQHRNRVRLERAVELIESDYAKPLCAQNLADAAGLSMPHFTRLFRQWTGHTPMHYLRHRRIDAAKVLLADVNLTIKEVAARVGFDDPYHFSRVFHKVDGLSPSDFREALLAGPSE